VLAPSRKILGDTLGRYQLLVQIGQGGMAEVFLGRLRGAAGFAKLVVIKRMHSHLSHDRRFIELFINEGRLVAKLSHPNICQVHELGEEDGSLFLVMEHLSGVAWEELARALPRGTELELPLIAGVLGQACEGLHHAHQLRDHLGSPTPVVHRDVSPQNLFVTTDGICKVLDFGVAKMSTSDRYSHTGVVLGKLPYMAPEQICAQPVDARTDVFAMGVVLWEALTGARLFVRPSDYLIWKAINEDRIPSVLEHRPELPPAIDAVVQRALQRDPARRFGSLQAFAQELRQAAAPLDAHALAEALRRLCAPQLAENALVMSTALANADRPPDEREPGAALERGAAEPGRARMMERAMPRGEAFVPPAPTRPGSGRWRWGWPYLALPAAAALAALAALVTHEASDADERAGNAAVAAGEPVEAAGAAEPTGAARPAGTAAAQAATVRKTDRQAPAASAPAPVGAVTADVPTAADARPDPGERRDDPRDRRRSTGPSGGRSASPPSKPSPPSSKSSAPSSPSSRAAAPGARMPAERVGYYSVDSRPYALVTIDGVPHGETPLYRIPLSPGSHEVRVVREDGATKTFSITIVAGKEVSSRRLKW
jgi:eukaryotic-like serine/threonine-protein kinase